MHQWQRVSRWLKKQFTVQALILMYHRVSDLRNDPHLLAVSPKRFAEQMEVIRKHYTPIRLQQLVETLQDGEVPNRAVILTFDDGYADNLHHAKPVLERYEVPATVFVTAGQVGSQREFWWDELDRLLLQPGRLPTSLRLNSNGSANEWKLGRAAAYTEEDFRRDRGWHVERRDDPSPRQRLFRYLYELLQSLSDRERQQILDDLREWAGAGLTGRASHRTLTLDEVILLSKGGLIEIGAHTLTHPSLATLPEADQRNEIQRSKDCLEAILKVPVTSFAYPNGSSNLETVRLLRELGFLCACSSQPDTVQRGADRFLLPRVVVRDWDRETFARWLRWWVGG